MIVVCGWNELKSNTGDLPHIYASPLLYCNCNPCHPGSGAAKRHAWTRNSLRGDVETIRKATSEAIIDRCSLIITPGPVILISLASLGGRGLFLHWKFGSLH